MRDTETSAVANTWSRDLDSRSRGPHQDGGVSLEQTMGGMEINQPQLLKPCAFVKRQLRHHVRRQVRGRGM